MSGLGFSSGIRGHGARNAQGKIPRGYYSIVRTEVKPENDLLGDSVRRAIFFLTFSLTHFNEIISDIQGFLRTSI